MSILDYNSISKKYESSLLIEKRKSLGIYYTDTFLSEIIIKDLCISENSIVLDPCCGVGSFIYAATKYGIKKAYGTDIDSDAIDICKTTIPNGRFQVCDTITKDNNYVLRKLSINEVDYIIGNPPYAKWICKNKVENKFYKSVKRYGNDCFIASLLRAFDLVKDDGIISYIIPKNFLHVVKYRDMRKYILEHFSIISIVDLGLNFKNVRGEQIVITIKKQESHNNVISIKELRDGELQVENHIRQSFYEDEIILFKNKFEFNIYRKISKHRKLMDVCSGTVSRGKSKSGDSIIGKEIRKFGFKNREVPHIGNKIFIQNIYSVESGIIGVFGGELNASETVTVITDGNEKMCRLILCILHSKICNYYITKYCFNNSRLTMHTDKSYLRKIPIPNMSDEIIEKIINIEYELEKNEYMSPEWFVLLERMNSLIYQAFQLTDSEEYYIETLVKTLQSNKWQYDKRK